MDSQENPRYQDLYQVAFTYPAVDNHAHPLLNVPNRNAVPFEGLISEAEGDALVQDARFTVACFRATRQLAQLFGLGYQASWEDVKRRREEMDYLDLCKLCFAGSGIERILIDDGLGGVGEMAEGYKWHDQFTDAPTKRIVRVEHVAEGILRVIFEAWRSLDENGRALKAYQSFEDRLDAKLAEAAADKEVVGFKSVVCYRTGLNVGFKEWSQEESEIDCILTLYEQYERTGKVRIEIKILNDYLVRKTMEIASKCKKPMQYHTGLGDSDITLALASPAHLQPLIKAYPDTPVVLLHSSYPYTRDAGYLTAVYKNVFLDFGEVFPFVSAEGQRSIIRQILELTPTNKIMWSSDGHWWPESYYLGIMQAREALYEVMSEMVKRGEIGEIEAIKVIKGALAENARQLYQLDT